MQELAILIGGPIGGALGLQQLQDQGSASADVAVARQEVAANERFEDAGLAAALAADDGDLRELDGGGLPELSEDVLKLVDDWDHGVP